jgi:DNA repair exonuclease SbcCD ATPase subunit
MDILNLRKEVAARKVRRGMLVDQKKKLNDELSLYREKVEAAIQARVVLTTVAQMTQQKFVSFVEDMVTLAIQSVFERDLKFIVNFEIKRNKSECKLLVSEGGGEPFVPKDEMGGGLLDVISLALRVVLWSLENPRSRNVLVLDEPLKFVGHGELMEKSAKMLRDISHRLGLQLIINTHEEELADLADRSWLVTHDGVKSMIVQQGKEEIIQEKKKSGLKRRK